MVSDERLNQTDLILLLLAAPTTDPGQRFRCDGITRLEKLIFLAQESGVRDEVAEPFTFEPYHYGPYSKAIYDSVDFLVSLKLMAEKRIHVPSGLDAIEQADALGSEGVSADWYIERQLSLTESGKAVARVLSTRLSETGKQQITEIKDRFGTMPLRQLLRYVYGRYPAYTEMSKIAGQL